MLKVLTLLALCSLSMGYLGPCHKEYADKLMAMEETGPLIGAHFPSCTDDGNYAAVQCIGSVCHCATLDGKRIPGYESSIAQFKDMKCLCARGKYEKELLPPMPGAQKPQCDALGNYNPRQCHEARCTCVDRYGHALDYEGHIGMASLMNCDCARRNSDMILNGENCMPHQCNSLGNYIKPRTGAC